MKDPEEAKKERQMIGRVNEVYGVQFEIHQKKKKKLANPTVKRLDGTSTCSTTCHYFRLLATDGLSNLGKSFALINPKRQLQRRRCMSPLSM